MIGTPRSASVRASSSASLSSKMTSARSGSRNPTICANRVGRPKGRASQDVRDRGTLALLYPDQVTKFGPNTVDKVVKWAKAGSKTSDTASVFGDGNPSIGRRPAPRRKWATSLLREHHTMPDYEMPVPQPCAEDIWLEKAGLVRV